ncbi:MAG: glycosyltransferase family 4 protein [bacterium]
MKIAQIICQFRPYKSGMSEAAYYTAKELSRKGNEVIVFTPQYDLSLKSIEEMDGFKIKRIKPVFKYGNAAFIPKLWKELDGFDIIHLHYPFFGAAEILWLKRIFNKTTLCPSLLKKGNKMKLVITYHMDVVGEGAIKKFFTVHTQFIMPRILKSADVIIASSFDYFKNSNAGKLKLEKEIIELPFGADCDIYKVMEKDARLMAKYKLEDDDKIILTIGPLDSAHYFKGVEYLIKAFKSVFDASDPGKKRNLKLMIIGDGNLGRYYENIASQLGITEQVIFAGRVNDEEKIKIINLSYVEVLASINQSEAFGIVLIEAMACAKPVIASNLPGVRSVVEEGVNGLLCEPKNIENLAGKIKYLLDNPHIARQMGASGLERVEKLYNWKCITGKLEKIYKTLI